LVRPRQFFFSFFFSEPFFPFSPFFYLSRRRGMPGGNDDFLPFFFFKPPFFFLLFFCQSRWVGERVPSAFSPLSTPHPSSDKAFFPPPFLLFPFLPGGNRAEEQIREQPSVTSFSRSFSPLFHLPLIPTKLQGS